MLNYGIIKHPDKDIDDVVDTTCVGVDLVDGSSWSPPCFSGTIILHCVLIPTSHNPADWPPSGTKETWHPALRRGSANRRRPKPCPACGVLPDQHPLDQPKRLRGTGLPCRGLGPRFSYDHAKREWVSDIDSILRRWRKAE